MITYVTGDATVPNVPIGIRVIPHVVNDIGVWGAGFVLALSQKWRNPEMRYRFWHKSKRGFYTNRPFDIGQAELVPAEHMNDFNLDTGIVGNLLIANMIGQHGVGFNNGVPAIRYDSLYKAMVQVRDDLSGLSNVTIHCPKFGAGLAGGDWAQIEGYINEIWDKWSVAVYVPQT